MACPGSAHQPVLPEPSGVVAGWALAAALCGLCAAAGAAPSWVQLETDLTVDREILDTRWSSVVRTPYSRPDYSLASAQPRTAWGTTRAMVGFIDMPAAHLAAAAPQATVRPQFALGGSSESLRGWLRIAGIQATHCMAPVMKMHSTFAGSTSHANVSVSARCAMH